MEVTCVLCRWWWGWSCCMGQQVWWAVWCRVICFCCPAPAQDTEPSCWRWAACCTCSASCTPLFCCRSVSWDLSLQTKAATVSRCLVNHQIFEGKWDFLFSKCNDVLVIMPSTAMNICWTVDKSPGHFLSVFSVDGNIARWLVPIVPIIPGLTLFPPQ